MPGGLAWFGTAALDSHAPLHSNSRPWQAGKSQNKASVGDGERSGWLVQLPPESEGSEVGFRGGVAVGCVIWGPDFPLYAHLL